MTALLDVRGLVVRYGGITALRGLDLQLQAGELLMISGPNGAGKSSLMQALAGLVKPQAGRVVFAGHLVTGRAPETLAALGLSLVPEGRHVFGSMTVLENLKVGAGMRADRLAVAADLDYVMELFPLLGERRSAQAGLLSGGQQQMLVIARALMTGPQLLAIDEPSLGLAPRVTDQVYEALMRLRGERGLALLIVEQSSTRALMTGGRLMMLREGRCVLEGQARALAPASLQQAYFGLEAAAP